MQQLDVVIVGAGPYGLSVAAHARERGLTVAVFGKPMESWIDRMPKGMRLRSHWWATNLSDPRSEFGFGRFLEKTKRNQPYPHSAATFIDYATWFRRAMVPDIDPARVSRIEHHNGRFVVTLHDGREVISNAVVMAIGLHCFAYIPQEFSLLSPELVTHSSEHNDFTDFRGRTVLVIGGGQSALESSALLHEAGAIVHNVSRRPIGWLSPDRDSERTLPERIRSPRSAFAPGWINWAVERMPYVLHRMPQKAKDRLLRAYLTPGVSAWLKDRVIGKVALHESCRVVSLKPVDARVEAGLSDGVKLTVDHVILATGYKVDVARLDMIDPSLRTRVRTHDGSPLLNRWFESSVPGLYFVGLSSMRSFGPLFRFVAGCKVAAPRVACAIERKRTRAVAMAPRTILKNTAANVVALSRLDSVARGRLHRNLPFVVYYHRVVDRLDPSDGHALPAMEISASMLERHLDWLGKHFRIISLEELDRELVREPRSRPPAVLTFDDGYSDVYHHAFPLLKRKGIPAGIFVITDLVGSSNLPMHEELHAHLAAVSKDNAAALHEIIPQTIGASAADSFSMTRLLLERLPFDEVQSIIEQLKRVTAIDHSVREGLRPVSWEMLAEMRDAGMTIGSHSRTHPFLTNESEPRVIDEVTRSRFEIRQHLGVDAACFAYPGGGFNRKAVQAVAAAGYKYGFSICRHTDERFPSLTIPRKGLWEQSCLDHLGRFSPAIMSCQAAGAFDFFSRCSIPHAA